MCQPILLGKIVPAGFRLSNLFLRFPCRFRNFIEIKPPEDRGKACMAQEMPLTWPRLNLSWRAR